MLIILKREILLFSKLDNYKFEDSSKSSFTANDFRRRFNKGILGRSSNKFESLNELFKSTFIFLNKYKGTKNYDDRINKNTYIISKHNRSIRTYH